VKYLAPFRPTVTAAIAPVFCITL